MPAFPTGSRATRRGRRLLAGLLLALGAASAAAEGPHAVTTQPLGELLFQPERRVAAEVISLDEAALAAEVAGRVVEVLVEVGDWAAAGTPLLRLDCRPHDYALQQARAEQTRAAAQLRFARSQVERARALAGRDISAELKEQRQYELNAAEAARQQAGAGLAKAELDVERCALVAPFDGVLTARMASVGDWLASGTEALRFTATDRVEVVAGLPAALADELATASAPRLRLGEEETALRLRARVARLDPQTRNRELRLVCAADCELLPGAAGELVWASPRPQLPAELLEQRDGELGVFLVEDGRARFLPLPGALRGRPVAPPPGLAGGAQLVVEGRQALDDGAAVTVNAAP